MRHIILFVLLCPGAATAGLLSGQGASVTDSTNQPRQTFSSNETIGFSQVVFNGVLSSGRIAFSFEVLAPNGNKVFTQSGNAVPGTVGNAAAQIAGMAISAIYQGPGTYTLKAYARLDGATLEQDKTFTISSPNILLIYPPNGAGGLTDNPITFQWYSSGATTYRITVADNISLYNPILQQTINAANSFTYPNNPNPSDPRQKLSAGQMYYWKIEGLNVSGNAIASSPVPFSFSIATVALTRDLAVDDLEVTGSADASGNIPFTVTVKNKGMTTESNVPLKVTLGGLPAPGSPVTMPAFMPSDTKTFSVSAAIPADQDSSLAIACITIFDDNSTNNCKTLSVTRPPAASTGTAFSGPGTGLQTAEQIWQAIQNLLLAQGLDLSAYNLVGMEGTLSRDELLALLEQLRGGQAQVSLTGPVIAAPGTSTPVDPFASATIARPESPNLEVTDVLTAEEAWKVLEPTLKGLGIDLFQYRLLGMDGTLTRAEVDALDQALREGKAEAFISGPRLPGAPADITQPSGPLSPPKAAVEPSMSLGDTLEWSGYMRPQAPKSAAFVVRERSRWKRLWAQLTDAPLPEVDFSKSNVVVVLGGREVRGDRVEIATVRPEGVAFLVRYKFVTYARLGRPNAPPLSELGKTYVPYLLKVVPNTVSKVRFELVKEKNDE